MVVRTARDKRRWGGVRSWYSSNPAQRRHKRGGGDWLSLRSPGRAHTHHTDVPCLLSTQVEQPVWVVRLPQEGPEGARSLRCSRNTADASMHRTEVSSSNILAPRVD